MRLVTAPVIGSPWLPHNLNVKLDTDLDPGVVAATCLVVTATVACWAQETIGQFTNAVISGLNSFRVSLTCYLCASLPFVPTHQAFRYRNACKAQYQARG